MKKDGWVRWISSRPWGFMSGALWIFAWWAICVLAYVGGGTLNQELLAVDFLGVATAAHADNSRENLALNYGVDVLTMSVLVTVPLLITLSVLWFVGPRLRVNRFRKLSFVMFFWFTPLMMMFHSGEYNFWIWLILEFAIAATIQLPQSRRRRVLPA